MRAYVFDPESPARYLGLEPSEPLAGFALYQWIQLEWPDPDYVIPMPDSHSIAIAKAFTFMLDLPFVPAIGGTFKLKEDRLEEDRVLLVIDVSNSIDYLQKATLALAESFPKRIFILSLLPYVNCPS